VVSAGDVVFVAAVSTLAFFSRGFKANTRVGAAGTISGDWRASLRFIVDESQKMFPFFVLK